jgi:ATP-binding cassette subfamily B protein
VSTSSQPLSLKSYTNLLGKYLRPIWLSTVMLSLLVLVSIGLQLVLPQLMRNFIDTVQSGGTLQALLRLALIYLGVALMQQGVAVGATYLGENVGWSATNALRVDLASHCLRLDLSFHNNHTPGEMIERIDGDVTALSNFFSRFIIQILGNALLLLGISIILFRVNFWVGLTITIFMLAVLFMLSHYRNIAVPHWKAERQASAELFGFLEERLAGAEDIRANGGKPYVMGRFYHLMRELLRRALRAALMINILLNATMVLFAIGNAAAFAVGANLFQDQVISLGTVYLIFQYTMMLQHPIEEISRQVQDLQRAGAAVWRSNELLAIESALAAPASLTGISNPGYSINATGALAVAFDQVTFTYPDAQLISNAATQDILGDQEVDLREPEKFELLDDTPGVLSGEAVLCGLSFHLEAGSVLGLLGRTGSGKTSLTRLIFRFYDPEQGTIRVRPLPTSEWMDLRLFPIEEVRRGVGMIPQQVQLFSASVRDNLTFFDPSIPDSTIQQALEELGLEDWLRALPLGLDTELGPGRGGLSAGQAQLLAFARIFLKDPGLVILDEASSRLDPATERLIEKAIDRLVQGRTAIIVAHRLSTVQRADQIMILDGGEVLEFGPRLALAGDPNSHFYHLLKSGLEEVLA